MLSGLNEELALPLLQRRPAIRYADHPLQSIAGRRVLVTGAGGSIGAELVQQVAGMRPASLTLIELSELHLYEINLTLAEAGVDFPVQPLLADVRDWRTLHRAFAIARPELVLHAAALKHVPLLENDHNLMEAVRTNVLGTSHVATLCDRLDAHLVLISTDKAVNPSSVMGLTKRAAEMAAAATTGQSTLSIVRFGNVLGSSGSFVPHFRRQIAQGGPVTVTHPDMRRFLMTIKEAVSLVLQASDIAIATAGVRESALFVLEMGKQIRIMDVATQLIEQVGLRPGIDIDIEITGVRPGEKLEEELHYAHEELTRGVLPGLSFCSLPLPDFTTRGHLLALERHLHAGQVEGVKTALLELVPSFTGGNVWR